MNAETKISRARIQLLLRHPFLGTLALALRVKDGKGMGCQTMATNGRMLWYSQEFVDGLSEAHLEGVIAHEIMHVVYQHVLDWRGSGKVTPIWTMATEYVVNDAVVNMFRLTLPGEPFLDSKYFGMYTEQVYAELLKKHSNLVKAWNSLRDAVSKGKLEEMLKKGMVDQHGLGDGMSPEEGDALREDIKMKVAQAAQAARMRGKLPSELERLVGEILNPKVPWRQVLAEFLIGTARDDYSWKAPNRRHIHRGFYLPSLKSEQIELAVAIDTSGSIGTEELTEFWSEVVGIMQAFPSYKIHLMGCDANVHDYEILEPFGETGLPALKGGGGTAFEPVFDKIEEECITPQAVIYLTDAYGSFPEEPDYPVLWVVKGSGEVPWGRRCEI